MQFAKTFLGVALTLFAAVLAGVFLWMSIFVAWLHYDYVTASNVFFIFLVTANTLQGINFMINGRANLPAVLSSIILYPLAFATALRVYEAWNHPAVSTAKNVVGGFRDAVAVPLTPLAQAIAGIGPLFASIIHTVDTSPLLTQIVAALTISLIHAALARLGGKPARA